MDNTHKRSVRKSSRKQTESQEKSSDRKSPQDVLHILKLLCVEYDKKFDDAVVRRDDVVMMQAALSYMGALLAYSELYDVMFGHDGRKTLLALLKQSKGFLDFAYVVEIYSQRYPCHCSDQILKTLQGLRDDNGFEAFRSDCNASFSIVAKKFQMHRFACEIKY